MVVKQDTLVEHMDLPLVLVWHLIIYQARLKPSVVQEMVEVSRSMETAEQTFRVQAIATLKHSVEEQESVLEQVLQVKAM